MQSVINILLRQRIQNPPTTIGSERVTKR